jgi:hypothetical protein
VDQSVFVSQLVWVTYVFGKPYQFQNIEGGGQTVDFQGPTVPVKDGRIVENWRLGGKPTLRKQLAPSNRKKARTVGPPSAVFCQIT